MERVQEGEEWGCLCACTRYCLFSPVLGPWSFGASALSQIGLLMNFKLTALCVFVRVGCCIIDYGARRNQRRIVFFI